MTSRADARIQRRHRLAPLAAAAAVVLVGAGSVVWLQRSGDLSPDRATAATVPFARGPAASSSATPPEQTSPRLAEIFARVGPYPGRLWTKDGQEVSSQDLSLAQGPDHCQWQRALFLGAVLPVGSASERLWTRDPEGVLTHYPRAKAEFRPRATLPADAADTGYRYDDVELWLAASDDGAYVYLVNAADRSDVERWVQGGGGCA